MADLLLRPRSATELIDAAFQLYRQYFVPMLTLSALVYLPAFVLGVASSFYAPGIATGDPAAVGPYFGLVAVQLLWYPIMEGSLMVAASERYLGREIGPGEAIGRAARRYGGLLGGWFLKWIVIGFWLVFLIIPGIYFFARYFAVAPAVLFEKRGPWAALGRSAEMAKGEKGKILKSLGLTYAIFLVITVTVALMFAPEQGDAPSFAMQLLSAIVTIVAFPLLTTIQALLYYDVRIRQEGFDIEVMAADLRGAAPAPTH